MIMDAQKLIEYSGIDLRKVIDKRMNALKFMSKETFETDIGLLLGGKVTLKIEFDYTDLKKENTNE